MKITLLCLTTLVLPTAAFAADPGWVLTTADFRTQPVALESVDDRSVSAIPVGQTMPVSTPFAGFLQLDRATQPAAAQERFTLHLRNGDRLAGAPAGYEAEQFVWSNAQLGQMRIPLKLVRGIVRTGKTVDGLEQARTDDLVAMSNGDSAKGIFTELAGDKVKMDAAGAAVEVPLSAVDYIHFAPIAGGGGPAPATTGPAFRVRLADGSTLTSTKLKVAEDQIEFALAADGAARKLPLAAVAAIEQLNGPVSWLSSRSPAQVVQVPFLSQQPKPTRMDAALGERPFTDGPRPLQFGSKAYARGIGVHAYSRVDYELDGTYAAFRTQYAVANGKNQLADVTVRIKLDGRTVHEAEHVRANNLSPVVLIDLPKAAKMLTLEVDYGDANDAQDRFNWLEPALLKKKPLPPPPPAKPVPPPATLPATRATTKPVAPPAE